MLCLIPVLWDHSLAPVAMALLVPEIVWLDITPTVIIVILAAVLLVIDRKMLIDVILPVLVNIPTMQRFVIKIGIISVGIMIVSVVAVGRHQILLNLK